MPSITSWLHKIFPCRFDEPRCLNNALGCRCGKKKSAKKAEQRADDLGRQAREAVIQGTTPSPQEQAAIDATYGAAARQQPFLEARSRQTGGQLYGEISPEARQYAELISRQAAAPTQINYQDLFDPLFQRAQQGVAAFANQRGIVGSGLELERLGRAGVDLTLGQAAARQQNALLNEQLRQQAVSELGGLAAMQGDVGTGARGEYAQFLGGQQSLADTLRARQAGGVVQAQQVAQPYFSASLQALQNRVGQSQQAVSGLGSAAGSIGGALLGNMLLPGIGGVIGSGIGGTLGGRLGGGGTNSSGMSDMGSVASLLNQQRAGNVAPSYGQPGYAGMGYVNNPQYMYQPPQRRNWLGG